MNSMDNNEEYETTGIEEESTKETETESKTLPQDEKIPELDEGATVEEETETVLTEDEDPPVLNDSDVVEEVTEAASTENNEEAEDSEIGALAESDTDEPANMDEAPAIPNEIGLDSEIIAIKDKLDQAETLDQLKEVESSLLGIDDENRIGDLLLEVQNKIKEKNYLALIEKKDNATTSKEFLNLSNEFAELSDYKDSIQLSEECKEAAQKINDEKKKKFKKIGIYVGGAVVAIGLLYVLFTIIIPSNHLKKGEEYLSKQHYEEAVTEFEAAGEYENASTQLTYSQACLDLKNKDYLKAIEGFEKVKDFKDSAKQLPKAYYAQAEIYYKKEDYDSAAEAYLKTNSLKDSSDKLYECGKQLILEDKAQAARDAFAGSKHDDAENYLNYAEGLLAIEDENYSKAIEYFDKTHDIAEVAGKKNYCNMAVAESYLTNGKLIEAIDIYNSLPAETEFNGVTAQTRQNALGQYKGFITTYSGSYNGNGKMITTQIHKRTGITEGWEGQCTKPGKIRFEVNKDGTLQMIGSFDYEYFYNYSVLSRNLKSSTDTLEINQTITSVPTQIADGNATLTFENGSVVLHYFVNSPNEDQYFTYEYETTITYTKK